MDLFFSGPLNFNPYVTSARGIDKLNHQTHSLNTQDAHLSGLSGPEERKVRKARQRLTLQEKFNVVNNVREGRPDVGQESGVVMTVKSLVSKNL